MPDENRKKEGRMKKRYQTFRKASLILGVVTLMLGLLPLTSLPGASVIFADDTPPGPPDEIPSPPEPENLTPPDDPPDEDPPEEELLLTELQFSLLSSSSGSGPTDQTPEELGLPEDDKAPGYQDDCGQSDDCEKVDDIPEEDPVNQVGEGETYNKKATVVVIKAGNEEFFFTPDGPECIPSDPYCVIWDDVNGTITVIRNGEGRDIQDISNIQFWNPEEDEDPEDPCECDGFAAFSVNGGCECEEEIYGCLDPLASNTSSDEGAIHDQSLCEYTVPDIPDVPRTPGTPGGGGGGTSTSLLLIPVTGADLSGLAGLQALLRSAGMAFMGAAAVTEGLSRRKTR